MSTRELTAIEASHIATLRATGRPVDDTYIGLLQALTDAANHYDAAVAGVYGTAAVTDEQYDAAHRAYNRAGAQFADYARELASRR